MHDEGEVLSFSIDVVGIVGLQVFVGFASSRWSIPRMAFLFILFSLRRAAVIIILLREASNMKTLLPNVFSYI